MLHVKPEMLRLNGPVAYEPDALIEGSVPVVVVVEVLYPKPIVVAFGYSAEILPLKVAVVAVTAVAETVTTVGSTGGVQAGVSKYRFTKLGVVTDA